MKLIEAVLITDRSISTEHYEGEIAWMREKLTALLVDIGFRYSEKTAPSVHDIFTNMETSRLVNQAEGVARIVMCVTSGRSEDSVSRALIEHELSILHPDVFFVFATIATDDSTQAWFERLIGEHPSHDKKFGVMRDYADGSISEEFAQATRLFIERIWGTTS